MMTSKPLTEAELTELSVVPPPHLSADVLSKGYPRMVTHAEERDDAGAPEI